MVAPIRIRGAREHNLQDVNLDIPRTALVVVTGPSGSGKSSLAFDTLFAEGQRRYVESLSVSARQFLDQLPRPDVDLIEGLSPTIAVQQATPPRSPRSTVGTATEIADFLRLLYARVGMPHCPGCGRELVAQTVQQIVDRTLSLPEGSRVSLRAPVVRKGRIDLSAELDRLRREGFVRVVLDGQLRSLEEEVRIDSRSPHDLDVDIDRVSVKASARQRITESVELALRLSGGLVRVVPEAGEAWLATDALVCVYCGGSLPELTPGLFSFNGPAGACEACEGLGGVPRFDPDLVIADAQLSLRGGAITAWGRPGSSSYRAQLERLLASIDLDPDRPFGELAAEARRRILYGVRGKGGFEGVLPGLDRRLAEFRRRGVREDLESDLPAFLTDERCEECAGTRLGPAARSVRIGGMTMPELLSLPLSAAAERMSTLSLAGRSQKVAARLIAEVRQRLVLLCDLGLSYLSLARGTRSLSGGELSRVRLATHMGASLSGVIYVLDEPSVGLHARDAARLLGTLCALRDEGNTVVVVEHDLDLIRAADRVIDMGPGAGRLGGQVVAEGTATELCALPDTPTGPYLAGSRRVRVPAKRRPSGGAAITVRGACAHNLRSLDVRFPLAVLTCVTGVSGSGKSSLVIDTLLPAARAAVGRIPRSVPADAVEGLERIDKVVHVDQSPIGRTPRSNPATYTGAFARLRALFADLPEARARGYGATRFSFNVKGGRCEACQGDGVKRIEMQFLPDVFVECEHCHGRRYNRETLEIHYRGKSIADVLEMTVDEAAELLQAIPRIAETLAGLRAVGLGYLTLGQSSTTLSGGEAQRLKLSRELSRRATGKTLYVLDEPTAGLHASDVEVLMELLNELVAQQNTVIVVEHNLEVVKLADHVIDLGPEGGDDGGNLVAQGTPEEVVRASASHTGVFLAPLLST